jgi:hypothetical protein
MKPPLTPAPSDSTRSQHSPSESACAVENGGTGLPWFRTWRGVYLFVFGSFLVWVVLLAWLTRFFA